MGKRRAREDESWRRRVGEEGQGRGGRGGEKERRRGEMERRLGVGEKGSKGGDSLT